MTSIRIKSSNLDRDTTLALTTLITFGFFRGVFTTDTTVLLTGQPLPSAFMQYLDPGIAFFLFVPLFCFCIFRRTNALLSSHSATRFGSRGSLLLTIGIAVALRALAFAVIIVASSLPFVVIRGADVLPVQIALFALIQILFQALFFLTTGTFYVAVRLVCGVGAIPFVAALFYAGVDALIQTLELTNVRTLWTGWLILGYADPSQPILALSGLLRLCALLAIGAFIASYTIKRTDFLPEGGHNANDRL